MMRLPRVWACVLAAAAAAVTGCIPYSDFQQPESPAQPRARTSETVAARTPRQHRRTTLPPSAQSTYPAQNQLSPQKPFPRPFVPGDPTVPPADIHWPEDAVPAPPGAPPSRDERDRKTDEKNDQPNTGNT